MIRIGVVADKFDFNHAQMTKVIIPVVLNRPVTILVSLMVVVGVGCSTTANSQSSVSDAISPSEITQRSDQPTPIDTPAKSIDTVEASPNIPASEITLIGNDLHEVAPRFTLPGADGAKYSLDSFTGESNVVLVFYRAFW